MNRGFLTTCGAACLLAASALIGCSSQPTKSRPQVPPQPLDLQPSSLLVWVQGPLDTDANAYGDTFQITIQMYSEDYPMASIAVPGSYQFKLFGKEGKELASWKFTEAQASAAVRRGGPGPVYIVKLSLLDVGGDKLKEQSAEFAAIFTPSKGQEVRSTPTSVRIGRQMY